MSSTTTTESQVQTRSRTRNILSRVGRQARNILSPNRPDRNVRNFFSPNRRDPRSRSTSTTPSAAEAGPVVPRRHSFTLGQGPQEQDAQGLIVVVQQPNEGGEDQTTADSPTDNEFNDLRPLREEERFVDEREQEQNWLQDWDQEDDQDDGDDSTYVPGQDPREPRRDVELVLDAGLDTSRSLSDAGITNGGANSSSSSSTSQEASRRRNHLYNDTSDVPDDENFDLAAGEDAFATLLLERLARRNRMATRTQAQQALIDAQAAQAALDAQQAAIDAQQAAIAAQQAQAAHDAQQAAIAAQQAAQQAQDALDQAQDDLDAAAAAAAADPGDLQAQQDVVAAQAAMDARVAAANAQILRNAVPAGAVGAAVGIPAAGAAAAAVAGVALLDHHPSDLPSGATFVPDVDSLRGYAPSSKQEKTCPALKLLEDLKPTASRSSCLRTARTPADMDLKYPSA